MSPTAAPARDHGWRRRSLRRMLGNLLPTERRRGPAHRCILAKSVPRRAQKLKRRPTEERECARPRDKCCALAIWRHGEDLLPATGRRHEDRGKPIVFQCSNARAQAIISVVSRTAGQHNGRRPGLVQNRLQAFQFKRCFYSHCHEGEFEPPWRGGKGGKMGGGRQIRVSKQQQLFVRATREPNTDARHATSSILLSISPTLVVRGARILTHRLARRWRHMLQ